MLPVGCQLLFYTIIENNSIFTQNLPFNQSSFEDHTSHLCAIFARAPKKLLTLINISYILFVGWLPSYSFTMIPQLPL